VGNLLQDLRYGLRTLSKNPGFAAVAVLTLALGIGANTAIFSVVYGVVLKPLPYYQPEKLVRIYTEFEKFPGGGLRRFWVSPPEYFDLKRDLKSWSQMEAWVNGGASLAATNQPIRVTASFVTGGLLPLMGVSPAIGRGLTPQDDVPKGPQIAVISDGLWRRAFGGDPAILGKDTQLNGAPCTIVGVMPKGFEFPPGEADPPEIWVTLQLDPASPGSRGGHFLYLIGRMRPETTLLQAQNEITQYTQRSAEIAGPRGHAFRPEFHTIVMFPLHGEVVRTVRTAMLTLLGAVFFVLLIACVNVANLLLARAETRHKEIAVRTALGASLWRLARQFITEGVLFSMFGAAAGLLLGFAGLRLIIRTNGGTVPRIAEVGMNGRVLLFTLAMCVVTGLFFGLAPLAQAATKHLHDSLKSAPGRTTATVAAQFFRRSLVVTQMALALALLIGSGLMVRSFWKLLQVDPGFSPEGLISMRVALPQSSYPDTKAQTAFWDRVQERMSALPGVSAATMMSGLPPTRRLNANDTEIEGLVRGPDAPIQNVDYWQAVGDHFFETMKIRLIEGRFFNQSDGPQSQMVVVINQSMARHFWKNESPIGRRVRPGGGGQNSAVPWYTVVGVVTDVKNAGMDQAAGTELFFYERQAGQNSFGLSNPWILLKASGDPASLERSARDVIRSIDPSLPLASVGTMEDVIARVESRPRFLSLLLTLFSIVALCLAAVGIYGLVAYFVAQRTNEIGIRMALGAQSADVLKLVVGHGMRLTLLGMVFGIGLAYMLTRWLTSLFFSVSATDPVTFAVITILLSFIALVACWIPARRATKVDPIIALRYE
jgi:putative ABC transport system permease protein